MSITINGVEFQELPYCCYSCKFFMDYGNHTECGYCTLFNKQKTKYGKLSKRCEDLFAKVATFQDGSEVVLVAKDKKEGGKR